MKNKMNFFGSYSTCVLTSKHKLIWSKKGLKRNNVKGKIEIDFLKIISYY